MRQALSALVMEGRLIRTQGRGTFVASPRIEQQLTQLTGFTQDMQARGKRPSAQRAGSRQHRRVADGGPRPEDQSGRERDHAETAASGRWRTGGDRNRLSA